MLRSRARLVRTIIFLFIIGIAVFRVRYNYSAGNVNLPMIGLTALLLVQLIFRLPHGDLVLGILLMLLSAQAMLAVSIHLSAHLHGAGPVPEAALYFGGISGCTFIGALLLIYLCSLPRVHPPLRGPAMERA